MTRGLSTAALLLLPLWTVSVTGISESIESKRSHSDGDDTDTMMQRGNGQGSWNHGPKALVPPRELVARASNGHIPCLAGTHLIKHGAPNADSYMITRETVGFRLRKSTDNKNRVMIMLTGRSNRMIFTRKADMTFKGATHLYDPLGRTKGPVGEIHMSLDTAAVRMTGARMMVDELAHAKYEVLSYAPSCPKQQPMQKDKTGSDSDKPLYSFARITKPLGVKNNWRVVRVSCYSTGEPKGEEAYSLMSRPDGIEVISRKKGLIGLVYRHPESESDYTDAWLTKGEDPLLFSAVIMTTQAPQSPVG